MKKNNYINIIIPIVTLGIGLFVGHSFFTPECHGIIDKKPLPVLSTDTSIADYVKIGKSYFPASRSANLEAIDLRTAEDMVDIYRSRRIDLISQREGFQDTKSITFDIKTMQSVINKMIDEGKNGIRFYLGVYPNGGLYPRRTSVVILGTYKKDSAQRTDALIELTNGTIKVPEDKPFWVTGLVAYNHGNLCPAGQNCP